MSIETTVLDFKLSNTFEEYEAHMNAPEQQAMFKEADLSEWDTAIKDYENEKSKCKDVYPLVKQQQQ